MPGHLRRKKAILGEGKKYGINMEKVALVVAGVKGLGVEEITNSAWENSVKMFFSGWANTTPC
jgi:Tat protein secretion system quality control protein TatD with DNase activity